MRYTITWIAVAVLGWAGPLAMAQDSPEPVVADRQSLLEEGSQIQDTMAAIDDYLAEIEAAAPEPEGDALELNARRAVELAIENNPQADVAASDTEAAEALIGQARSRIKPQLGASMTFTHTDYKKYSGGILGDLTTGLIPDDNMRTDKFELNQVFYAGGQIRAAIRASKFLAESQAWQEEATLQRLEFEAKQAYYDALAAQGLERVAQQSVRSFERNLADAEQMFSVGMISNFEVLRARTELGTRKAALIQAKNGFQLAKTNLRRIIGVPQSTPVVLESKIDWLPYLPDAAETVAYALEHLPEVRALRQGIEAAEQDIKRLKGQYLPGVGGNAQWSNTDGGGSSLPDGFTFSVGAQLDIYAGGRRKYEVLEAEAKKESLEGQLADLEQEIELSVKAALIQLRDAMAKYSSERGTVKLAEEGLRLAELRFLEGVGTQSETLDAEFALTGSESSLVIALRDFAVANAVLERATGKSWIRDDIDEVADEDPEK